MWKIVSLDKQNPYDVSSYHEAMSIAIERGFSQNSVVLSKLDRPVAHGMVRGMINLAFCKETGIPIIRGIPGSVNSSYFDELTSLNYACYYPTTEMMTKKPTQWWQETICKVLMELGLQAVPRKGKNDILINKRKVCSMKHHSYKAVYVMGFSLIMDFNYDLAEKVHIPKSDLRETITGINVEAEREVSNDEMTSAFKKVFEDEFQEEVEVFYELTEAEKKIVDGLREKYTSESWVKYGKWSPIKDYWRPK